MKKQAYRVYELTASTTPGNPLVLALGGRGGWLGKRSLIVSGRTTREVEPHPRSEPLHPNLIPHSYESPDAGLALACESPSL